MAGAFVAGAIVSSLILDTKKWSSSVSKVNSDQAKMAGMSQKTATKFKAVGAGMTIVGAAIVGGMGKAIAAFGDFDQAMTESTSIMGDLSQEMRDEMAQTALDMSGKSAFAAKDLGEAYYFLASAGLDAEKSIAALPVVTSFATAGAFDLATATDLLTDAQSALGLSGGTAAESQQKMVRVSDVLVKANTLANASVQQFSEALTNRSGPAMRAYGIDVESGVAVLAAFADQGIKGSEAGTMYSIVLRDLQKSALSNKKAFETAGIAVYDANGNLNNMADIVGQLETRLGGMSAEQKKVELSTLGFQEKSQGALLTLLGTSDAIRKYEKELRSAGGVTQEVSDKQLEGFNKQMEMAKNRVMAAVIPIGEQLAPVVLKLADAVSKVVTKFADWAKANPALFGTITKIVAGLGALMLVLGPIVMILPKLIMNMKLLNTQTKGVSGALGKLGLVATAAFVGWEIGKQIGQLKILGKTIDEHVQDKVTKLIDTLEIYKSKAQAGEGHTAALAKRQKILADASEKAGTKITNLHDAMAILNGGMTKAEKAAAALVKQKKELKEKTEGIIKPINELSESFKTTIQPITDVDARIVQLSKDLAEGTITVSEYFKALTLLDDPLARLQDRIENMPMDDALEGVDSYVTEWESVPDATQSVFEQIGLQSLSSQTEIEKHAEGMKTNVTSIWDDMADGLKTKWSTAVSDLITSGDLFRGDFTGLVDTMKTQFFDMVGQMAAKITADLFGVIIDGAADAAKSLLGSLGDALGGGGADSVTGGFESVSDALASAANPIGLISGAVTAIASVASLFKKAGPSSTDSWHFEQTWIQQKQLTDYTMAEIGGSGGWFARIHDKTNQVVLKNEYQMKQNRKMVDNLKTINTATAEISRFTSPLSGDIRAVEKAVRKIPKAQHGYTSTKPELVMLHGTPAKPEHAIPDDRLRALLSSAGGGGGGRGDVSLESNQEVNFNGLMISDRDYMRTRGIPELLSALDANVGLAKLKSIIGVT